MSGIKQWRTGISFYRGWYAGCLVFAVVFTTLSFFCHPGSDDYMLGFLTSQTGYLDLQRELYLKWQGRYFSSFLIPAWAAGSLRYHIYWLHPLLLLLLTFLSVWDLLRQMSRLYQVAVNSRLLLFVSSLVLLALVFTLPSVFEGYFWLVGSLAYQPGFIMLLLLAAQYCRMALLPAEKRRRPLALSVLLSVMLGGSIEIVILVALLALLYWWLFINRPGLRKEMIVITAVIATGSLFTALAPGTLERTAHMSGSRLAVLISFGYWPMRAITAIASQPLFWATCICLYAGGSRFGLPAGLRPLGYRNWLWLLLLPFIALLPILAVSGGSLPLRLLNVVVQCWVLLSAAFFYWLGANRPLALSVIQQFVSWKWLLLLLLVTGIIANGYGRNLLQGYFYDQVMHRNEMLLRANRFETGAAETDYKQAVGAVYRQLPPGLQKELLWETVKNVPDLIGNYSDFENFNEKSTISLYYRSVFR